MRADLIVFDGVDELDVVGPLEVLRSAGSLDVRLVTRARQPAVTGAHGLVLQADATYEPGAEWLIVPGGGWVGRAQQGAWAEAQRGHLVQILRRAETSGTAELLAGVCTGTMLLAYAGVTTGRRATTHPEARAELAEKGATVVDERVVDDGTLVTCGGVTAGLDLALWLLERQFGREVADRAAARLDYARFRPGR